jgi:Na+/H+ antiporter NhaD/arsenite permease-like protein
MTLRLGVLSLFAVLLLPASAWAAGDGPLDLPAWSVTPFALLLLAIAVLPVAAEHFWHSNRNKAIVAALCALPAAGYLIGVQLLTGRPTVSALVHELGKYLAFIILLGSLYTVSGGLVLQGDIRARPLVNTAFLAFGAALANLVGTTGASMLLIRPVLRINKERTNSKHVPLFFIFTVSNLGGLLTPLGDPPLFLGFLNGVPFTWTLAFWPAWLLVNGIVLVIFFVWDALAFRREPRRAEAGAPLDRRLRLSGLVNLPLLAGIIVGVLIQGALPDPWGELSGAIVMVVMAGLSLQLTGRGLREANHFSWGPILEVAILFAGIFITMVPALELLGKHGKEAGISQPWQFFWLTGGLSAFLDNAPTYLTFATMAAGSRDFDVLVRNQAAGMNGPLVLAAISCGAVFLGALTYIGNGPNFMVKAIADEAGFRMPSFFGYLGYASIVLLPVFLLYTVLFLL